jgi:hypothetical protein
MTPCLQSMAKMSSTVHGLASGNPSVHLSTTTFRPVGVGCGCQRDPLKRSAQSAIAAARHRSSQTYPGGTCQAGYLSCGGEQCRASEQLAAIFTKVPARHDMWFAHFDLAGLAAENRPST